MIVVYWADCACFCLCHCHCLCLGVFFLSLPIAALHPPSTPSSFLVVLVYPPPPWAPWAPWAPLGPRVLWICVCGLASAAQAWGVLLGHVCLPALWYFFCHALLPCGVVFFGGMHQKVLTPYFQYRDGRKVPSVSSAPIVVQGCPSLCSCDACPTEDPPRNFCLRNCMLL